MNMKAFIRGFALGALVLALPIPVKAQSSNPFNPDYAWCATQGSVVIRKAATWGCLLPGTAGQVLRSNGPGQDASWLTTAGSGTVTSVGLALPSIFNVTGSPVTAAGTLTGALASQTANQLFIAPNGSNGTPTFRSMLAADMPNAGVASGSVISGTWPTLALQGSSVGTTQIVNNAVTNAKLATQPDNTIKSNISGATAAPSDNTIAAVIDKQLGTTHGSIAIRNGTQWTSLAPSAGQILQSNGVGANPSWVSPSAAIPAAVGIGHRLTLTSGSPVMSGNVSGAIVIYSTPYQSDLMLLWDGSQFVPTHCAETSQALTDVTKSPSAATTVQVYDLFAWNDGGVCRVTRGPAWSAGGGSNTVRGTGAGSTAIARTNFGILTNSVAITNGPAANYGTYMGTVMTDASTQTVSYFEGSSGATCSAANVGIWNMYNRVSGGAIVSLTSGTHTYSSTTPRFYGNSAQCSHSMVRGLDDENVGVSFGAYAGNVAGGSSVISIGVDNATAVRGSGSVSTVVGGIASNSYTRSETNLRPGVGAHTIYALENGDGTNTVTFVDTYFSLTSQFKF